MAKQFYVFFSSFEKDSIAAAIESGVDAIILPDGNAQKVKEMGKIKVIASDGDMQMGRDIDIIKINKKEDEDKVVKYKGSIPVIIDCGDWTIIPLENLISKTTNLIQSVSNEEEAEIALKTMECGADGICLMNPDFAMVKAVAKVMESQGNEKFDLVEATIVSVDLVEMSDRCAIDTSSILPKGSGFLIGDSSQGMFLVHNENVESPFCDPRPFRVNAGAVHAYVRLPDNKTKYLCELSAGDNVLCVDHEGSSRVVAVGRNKIERRPMLLIKAEYQGKTASVILQNAETIRLTQKGGGIISVVNLKLGDKVLAYFGALTGRHFGSEVVETITEK